MRKRLVSEQATVYWGGGRRWLHPSSAAKAEAVRTIRRHCECSAGDETTPAETCALHMPDRYLPLRDKLANRFMRKFRKEGQ